MYYSYCSVLCLWSSSTFTLFCTLRSASETISLHILRTTLRASLSGTFLQTLPDLVTPLKGHSLSLRSCPPTLSAPSKGLGTDHTPSIAFRHLPPNFARFSYATEGALFISAQLSTDAVSVLRKVRVLIGL